MGPDDLAGQIPYLFPSIVPYWIPRGVRNMARWASREILPGRLAGRGVGTGVDPSDYGIPNYRADYVRDNPGIPCGFWRGVGHVVNAFAVECFMDELAQAQEKDPLAWRLPLLGANPRLARVLELAARGGEDRTGGGLFSGLAGHVFHGAPAAMRAQVAVEEGRVVVKKVVAAVDCGRVINPRQARHQIEGGIAFALSAALNSEITFEKGHAVQSNFDDFPIVTMAEMPQVEVRLVESQEPPLGLGEVPVPPLAPAVANAVSRAVGRRIRRLPISLA